MTASAYHRPQTLDAALALASTPRAVVLAGGTDVFANYADRTIDRPLIDIGGIAALRGIRREGDTWRIGALATWSDVIAAPWPDWADALVLAAREVGGVQIQNAGTVAGNLCNASPAADGVPALLALDARVEIAAQAGRRVVPLVDFIAGPRKTTLATGEIVTAILLPDRNAATRSAFMKLGARRYLVISIAMVAAAIEADARGRITRAALAAGACSPVARRLAALEARIVGRTHEEAARDVAPADLAELAPIDDVRADAEYRRDAAATLLRRAILACATGEAAR